MRKRRQLGDIPGAGVPDEVQLLELRSAADAVEVRHEVVLHVELLHPVDRVQEFQGVELAALRDVELVGHALERIQQVGIAADELDQRERQSLREVPHRVEVAQAAGNEAAFDTLDEFKPCKALDVVVGEEEAVVAERPPVIGRRVRLPEDQAPFDVGIDAVVGIGLAGDIEVSVVNVRHAVHLESVLPYVDLEPGGLIVGQDVDDRGARGAKRVGAQLDINGRLVAHAFDTDFVDPVPVEFEVGDRGREIHVGMDKDCSRETRFASLGVEHQLAGRHELDERERTGHSLFIRMGTPYGCQHDGC